MPTTPLPALLIRILLFNSDLIARSGVKLLLENRPGLKVIAEAGDKETTIQLAAQEHPDIVLIHDNGSSPLDFELFTDLIALNIKPRMILVTSQKDSQYHLQAVKKGALGVVGTHNPPDVLLKAIEKVNAGEVWLDRNLIANYFIQESHGALFPGSRDPHAARIAQLSEREREVIALVGEGLKNQQIADQLFVSEVTVRHHLTSIYKKLSVTDRLELVIYAYQNNLARLPE